MFTLVLCHYFIVVKFQGIEARTCTQLKDPSNSFEETTAYILFVGYNIFYFMGNELFFDTLGSNCVKIINHAIYYTHFDYSSMHLLNEQS